MFFSPKATEMENILLELSTLVGQFKEFGKMTKKRNNMFFLSEYLAYNVSKCI